MSSSDTEKFRRLLLKRVDEYDEDYDEDEYVDDDDEDDYDDDDENDEEYDDEDDYDDDDEDDDEYDDDEYDDDDDDEDDYDDDDEDDDEYDDEDEYDDNVDGDSYSEEYYDEIRARLAAEIESMTGARQRTLSSSRSSLETWIYNLARSIARFLTAPLRWIVEAIEGFIDGLFGD